ncbi:MAG: hypothetical protein LBD70_04585, partial [Bifidobacteriaceae bacterium]|nr:hypothetical protein [Bifidobacteriaceae bacterium]
AGLDPAASVGRITSVGLHYELGPIALALVKRSLPEDAALAVAAEGAPGGSIAAAQTRIVPASGESDARPAPGRLGLGRGRPGLGQGRLGLGQGRPGRGGLGPGRLGPG